MITKATIHFQDEMFIVLPHIVAVKKEVTEKYDFAKNAKTIQHSLKVITDGEPINIHVDSKEYQDQVYSNFVTMLEDYYRPKDDADKG